MNVYFLNPIYLKAEVFSDLMKKLRVKRICSFVSEKYLGEEFDIIGEFPLTMRPKETHPEDFCYSYVKEFCSRVGKCDFEMSNCDAPFDNLSCDDDNLLVLIGPWKYRGLYPNEQCKEYVFEPKSLAKRILNYLKNKFNSNLFAERICFLELDSLLMDYKIYSSQDKSSSYGLQNRGWLFCELFKYTYVYSDIRFCNKEFDIEVPNMKKLCSGLYSCDSISSSMHYLKLKEGGDGYDFELSAKIFKGYESYSDLFNERGKNRLREFEEDAILCWEQESWQDDYDPYDIDWESERLFYLSGSQLDTFNLGSNLDTFD